MADDALTKQATETYLYGFPLVYNLREIDKLLTAPTVIPEKVGLNEFGFARELLGPDAQFVSPNNDTLYLIAVVDVSGGPVLLQVPDTGDRYYCLQLVDAWTNNFAYVGRRATGTTEASYLLAPSGYAGDVPAGSSVIELPTEVAVIVGRIAVEGTDDLPAAHALQDQFTLTPVAGNAAPKGLPLPSADVGAELEWWERFRVALGAFWPGDTDREFLDTVAALGISPDTSVRELPDETRAALAAAVQQGDALIDELQKSAFKIVGGWSSALHAFDYNLDHLGPGTIDAPEWKIADRKTAYVTRAVAARAGLWGNNGYEADYLFLWQDEHGDDLDGSRSYELTLSPPPPVGAFWSLTMYDTPSYYLVANPIDRYSIGDRTPGLVTGADGSVTILLQHESPGKDRESNWLPAPAGRFRPILRAYQPGDALLDGTYWPPKVKRLS